MGIAIAALGWAAWTASRKGDVPTAQQFDAKTPDLLDFQVERLERIRRADEASFLSGAPALAVKTRTVTVELSKPLVGSELDVVVLSGESRAEIARAPAAGSAALEFRGIPNRAAHAVLTHRDRSARREYVARAPVDPASNSARLDTSLGTLKLTFEVDHTPSIIELLRPIDSDWIRTAHVDAARRRTRASVVFDDLGPGSYLVVVHDDSGAGDPIPITLEGGVSVVPISSPLR